MSQEAAKWYRPEIDGLRALAVLPVVLYHAGFDSFEGGYVGVDVFFVISGYLITGILLRELRRGEFSLLNFYERRARRILPALCLVLVCCIPVAWLILPPRLLKDFFQAIGATNLFAANILFWRESGYFQDESDTNPLLHMWSLAVEEQFYIVLPIFLGCIVWANRRRGKPDRPSIVALLLAAGVASFIWMEVSLRADPDANFYLAPSRSWELIAGSLCALAAPSGGLRTSRAASSALSSIGLAMIMWSVFTFTEATPFPSAHTLLPVFGTALVVLYSNANTITARLLSTRPLVSIGLISYSLYLWHLPIFVFVRVARLERVTLSLNVTLIGCSVFLAYLSWRFVERPFRRPVKGRLANQRGIFGLAAISTLALLGVAAIGHTQDGFPGRFTLTANDAGYLQTIDLQSPDRFVCQASIGGADARSYAEACHYGDTDRHPTVAILGDSHAVAVAYELAAPLKTRGLNARLHAFAGCGPLGDPFRSGPEGAACERWSREVVNAIGNDSETTTVIIAYKFAALLDGIARGRYPDLPEGSSEEWRHELGTKLQQVVEEVSAGDKTIIVVPQAPELPKRAYSLVYGSTGNDDDRLLGAKRIWWDSRARSMTTLFESFDDSVRVVPTTELFCDDDYCLAGRDGIAYYRDDNHLNLRGAQLVVGEIMSIVDATYSTPDQSSGN